MEAVNVNYPRYICITRSFTIIVVLSNKIIIPISISKNKMNIWPTNNIFSKSFVPIPNDLQNEKDDAEVLNQSCTCLEACDQVRWLLFHKKKFWKQRYWSYGVFPTRILSFISKFWNSDEWCYRKGSPKPHHT